MDSVEVDVDCQTVEDLVDNHKNLCSEDHGVQESRFEKEPRINLLYCHFIGEAVAV